MKDIKTYNVYCDESCHLENDGISAMAWGGVYCEKRHVRELSTKVREIKTKYGVGPQFEAKWKKISPGKEDFYLSLIDLFLEEKQLRFRGLMAPDKQRIEKSTVENWYFDMYSIMLRPIFDAPHCYRIYLDVQDTRGGERMKNLREALTKDMQESDKERIGQIQQVPSHESELMQITDLLIGALTYANRGLTANKAKFKIVTRLRDRLGLNLMTNTSALSLGKFSMIVWKP